MQGYVPQVYLKRKPKLNIKLIVALVLVIFLCGTVLIISLGKNKSYDVFERTTFYYVSAKSSKKNKDLEHLSSSVKSLGGAGITIKHKENYYMIVNVYLDKSDAEEIAASIKSQFVDSEVVEVKIDSISKQNKSEIKSNSELKRFFKLFNNMIQDIQNTQMMYLSGEITESELCKEIINYKMKLEDSKVMLKEIETSVSKLVQEYQNMLSIYFEKFFNEFFGCIKKHSILCDFVVNLTIVKTNLFDNL